MKTLNGWKAIAAHLGREERTAMRWAAERGLPVHRAPGPGRGSIYAQADEIDAWLTSDRARAAEAARTAAVSPTAMAPARPSWTRLASMPRWRRRGWVASALTGCGIVLAAVGALTLRSPANGGVTSQPVFTDPAAKAAFLQARYDWNLRTPDSLQRATREYSEAIGRDPRVPAGYVGLTNTYLLLREYGSMPDADAYPRAEAAAQAAAALSPQSAETQRALAFIAFWWRQDRAAARQAFARAIALDPDDPLTHHWFATALLANGEARAALREIDSARDLDPTATALLADRGLILYIAGQHAAGLDVLHELAREQPLDSGPHRYLAMIALAEGRADTFLDESAALARIRGHAGGLADIARWRAAGPGPASIEAAMLRDAESRASRQGKADWFRVAQLAALLGHGDQAMDALGRACTAHEPAAISAPTDLWLAHALTPADIAQRCGQASLLS